MLLRWTSGLLLRSALGLLARTYYCCCGYSGSGSGSGMGGDDPILTDCCAETVSRAIFAHISAKTGTCSCMPDVVVMIYQGVDVDGFDFWQGEVTECGNDSTWILRCNGEDWELIGTNLTDGLAPSSVVCDPLELYFPGLDGSGICTPGPGGFNITITEDVNP